jgi:G:T-mismatch repair DNA endonuclease (very short patch repair protein)
MLSNRTLAFLAAGRMPTVSSQELAVADALDSRGVEYEAQVAIRDPDTGRYFACVDFLLANGSVIEVYGSYWHGDPRMYERVDLNATQRQVVEKDSRKQETLRRLGIPFVTLWERDLAADLEGAVACALDVLLAGSGT